jgi:hypothetical protein
MRKPEFIVLGIGLALPFIGNILGAILYGEFPLYFRISLVEFFVLESLHLIPVALCIFYYYKASVVLKWFRYAPPIVITYLFIIYCHYEATAVIAELKITGTGYTGAAITAAFLAYGAPFLSIPVFFVAFLFSYLFNIPAIRREEKLRQEKNNSQASEDDDESQTVDKFGKMPSFLQKQESRRKM